MTDDPRTVPAALDRLAQRLPDHDALITDERSFTAAALREEVRRAAAALISLGVAAGRPGGHLVAEHLALGGRLPGDPPRRRGHGAAEHPLYRRRSRRHPGPHRCARAVRNGAVPRRRPGRRPGSRRAARAAAHRPDPDRGRRRDMGRLHRPRLRPGRHRRGRGPRRRRHARRRQRHPVHLGHHRPQQRRAVRAPAVAVGLGVVGRQRQDHQRRPLPVHQPVLPQLRVQGRHPGLPADRCDADPAPDLRPAARAAGDRATPHHRAARAAHHLPDPAGPSAAQATTT